MERANNFDEVDLNNDNDVTSSSIEVIQQGLCSDSSWDMASGVLDHSDKRLPNSGHFHVLPTVSRESSGRSQEDLETSANESISAKSVEHKCVADIEDGKKSLNQNTKLVQTKETNIGTKGGEISLRSDETVQTQPSTRKFAEADVAATTSVAMTTSEKSLEKMTDVECSKHGGREVEYFCQIHNAVGCSVCMTIEHRVCNVAFVPEVSKNVASSQEYKSVRSNIDNLRAHILRLHQTAVGNKAKNKEYLHKGEMEINNFVSNIDANVLEMKSQGLKSLQQVQEANEQILDRGSRQCLEFIEELDTLKAQLNSIQSDTRHEPNLFIALKASATRLENLQQIIMKTSNDVQLMKYTFVPDPCLSQRMLNSSLGTIKHQVKDCPSHLHITQAITNSVVYDIQSDEHPVLVNGFCPLFENFFLMTDGGNMALKVIKIFNQRMVTSASKKLNTIPWDVAVVHEVAFVTMPEEFLILCFRLSFVKKLMVKQIQIEDKRGIRTDGKCTGLAVCKSLDVSPVLIVIVQKEQGPCVQFRRMENGSVLKQIDNNCYGRPIFVGPAYLTIKHDQIYVSDFEGSSIVCLSVTGEPVWVFTTKLFSKPVGICAGSNGNVYVCCRGSLNLTCVTPNRKELWQKNVQYGDSVLIPRLIVQHKGHFYVVTGNQLDNKIKVVPESNILVH